MDKLLYWIRKELIFHLEFYGTYPHTRIGLIWIIMAVFFFGYFSYILCGVVTIITIYNLINRR